MMSAILIKEGPLTKSSPGKGKKCSRRHFRLMRLNPPFMIAPGRKESLGRFGISGAALLYYDNEVKMLQNKYIRKCC